MENRFYAVKDNQNLSFLDINAIFSAMYTPHTPADTAQEKIRHYQRLNDDFYVYDNKEGALLKGNITQTLVDRLKGFGVKLTLIN